ncbi:MAG: hypothetical protein COT73_12185 [Bdellovibrio sp. CG10_big_fil_rev_8_21_14_0_10_47_8]|nr:MAG: hypothetical protein COT73_12185 [Bdellovibrio sp. CG10_big_fil_rev_8_21_14_0_10_47_8]
MNVSKRNNPLDLVFVWALVFIFIGGFFTLSGCTNRRSEVSQRFDDSVSQNQAASSYADWHAAPAHSEKVFSTLLSQFNRGDVTSKDVCASLADMKIEDLTLFENEIRSTEMQPLLGDCDQEVKGRLDAYWQSFKKTDEKVETKEDQAPKEAPAPKAETKKTSQNLEDLSHIHYVDVSQGYFAVTGDLLPGQVALTFDDGPSRETTPEVLEALEQANVHATFFTLGNAVRANPEILKEVAAQGHSIGSHSTTHRCLPAKRICEKQNGYMMSVTDAIKDIQGGHQAIRDVLGWVDPFFRFPFGESSPELKSFLQRSGTGEFYWSIDSNDWRARLPDGTVYDVDMMIDNVMKELGQRKRGIILMHDIQRKTATALPTLIQKIRDAGYELMVFRVKDEQIRYQSGLLTAKIFKASQTERVGSR